MRILLKGKLLILYLDNPANLQELQISMKPNEKAKNEQQGKFLKFYET